MCFTPDTIASSEVLVAWFNVGTDRPISQATMRQWVRRGKLEIRGTITAKRGGMLNLYRYGDVAALIATRRSRQELDLLDLDRSTL